MTCPMLRSSQPSSPPSHHPLEIIPFKNLCYPTRNFQHLNYVLIQYNVYCMLHFHVRIHICYESLTFINVSKMPEQSLYHTGPYMYTHERFSGSVMFFCIMAPCCGHVSYFCNCKIQSLRSANSSMPWRE